MNTELDGGTPSEDLGQRLAVGGSVLGALAMTSCCILPLVLFSLGATGAWIGHLSALTQYKWMFLAFAGVSLAYGFWTLYRPAGGACAEGAACARPVNRGVMKALLWTASAVVLVSLAFPYLAPLLLRY